MGGRACWAGDAAAGKTALVQMWRSEGTAFPKNYKMVSSPPPPLPLPDCPDSTLPARPPGSLL